MPRYPNPDQGGSLENYWEQSHAGSNPALGANKYGGIETRKTVSNWQEICDLIKGHLENEEHIRLTPVNWEGWKKKDKKTKGLLDEVDKDKINSIVFEVETYWPTYAERYISAHNEPVVQW